MSELSNEIAALNWQLEELQRVYQRQAEPIIARLAELESKNLPRQVINERRRHGQIAGKS